MNSFSMCLYFIYFVNSRQFPSLELHDNLMECRALRNASTLGALAYRLICSSASSHCFAPLVILPSSVRVSNNIVCVHYY